MGESIKVFKSLNEEADYWCEEANKYKERYEATLEELKEYQASSQELETELETQLTQSEVKVKEFKVACSRLQDELKDVKGKYEKLQFTSYTQISDLESKLNTVENYKETLRKYVRELEQINDDLERANRAALASIDDFEDKLNQAVERNVFLETELDEKETVFFADIQHLKEETKDLKQELAVRTKKEEERLKARKCVVLSASTSFDLQDFSCLDQPCITTKSDTRNIPVNTNEEKKCYALHSVLDNDSTSNLKLGLDENFNPKIAQTIVGEPNKKAALAMVGDMIKRVGYMEAKLLSCQPPVIQNACL